MVNTDKRNQEIKISDKSVKEIEKIQEMEECFVIMPIGDHPSHSKGHFKRIYEDILKPAIEDAGFRAYRADDNGGSQNIQIDIIKKIIEAPMAICDLSTRNPNVLFELGVRQAFDKPVALIQEIGTERIFDISTFNTADYRSQRIYNEVIEDRNTITHLIKETYKKHNEGDGINSIIRLIPGIDAAKKSNKDMKTDELVRIMYNQINSLTNEVRDIRYSSKDIKSQNRWYINNEDREKPYYMEGMKLLHKYEKIMDAIDMSIALKKKELMNLYKEIDLYKNSIKVRILSSEFISLLGKLKDIQDEIKYEMSIISI